jgi:hypothetical protein
MSSTVHRIEACEALLSLIARKRAETGDPTLGSGIERMVIARQIRELECDLLADPGAIEPVLVPCRRGGR